MKAAKLLGIVIAASAAMPIACGSPPPATTPASPPPKASATSANDDKSGFAQRDFTTYRSDRFGIGIPLPDRASWTIVDRDDQNGGWLVATHPATATVLRARRFEETTLVGRRECELRARFTGELPKQEAIDDGRFQTLADEPLHRPLGWDGHRWVAFESRPGGKLVGHAFLVSGHSHACLVVHVIAEVKGDTDADALADRLELFSSRTIGMVTADRAKEPDPLIPEPPKGVGGSKGP